MNEDHAAKLKQYEHMKTDLSETKILKAGV